VPVVGFEPSIIGARVKCLTTVLPASSVLQELLTLNLRPSWLSVLRRLFGRFHPVLRPIDKFKNNFLDLFLIFLSKSKLKTSSVKEADTIDGY
jgi:hypothetical protein